MDGDYIAAKPVVIMNLLISLCDVYDAGGRTLCCVQNELARKKASRSLVCARG